MLYSICLILEACFHLLGYVLAAILAVELGVVHCGPYFILALGATIHVGLTVYILVTGRDEHGSASNIDDDTNDDEDNNIGDFVL